MTRWIHRGFILAGASAGAWGITDTLAGSPLTGFAGVVGMVVLFAAAMATGD